MSLSRRSVGVAPHLAICLDEVDSISDAPSWITLARNIISKAAVSDFLVQVELKASSLNKGDVFILQTDKTIWQWNGSDVCLASCTQIS